MNANNQLLAVAMSQLGTKEIVGSEHEREVLKYYNEIGHAWVKDDELPWCAAFLNWVCLNSFVPMVEKSQRLRARAFLAWGMSVREGKERQGDVVVLWRGTKNGASGHVGLLVGWSEDRSKVYLLGGNQGNRVCIAPYDAHRILDIRRSLVTLGLVFAPKLDLA